MSQPHASHELNRRLDPENTTGSDASWAPARPSPEAIAPDLVSLLSHQLLTPLATIGMLAQSLGRQAGSLTEDEVRARADKIRKATLRLAGLIETLMARARMDAGVITVKPVRVDLRALVERFCDDQQALHPEHRLAVAVEALPEAFEVDPILLEQVLAIVLSNAGKYTPPGRLIRIVGLRREEVLEIVVEDEGIGIPALDLPRLAQPFFRARNTLHLPGTGLGLNLARHILALHGGTLAVDSAEGQGTRVTIMLPIHDFGGGEGI